MANPVMDGLLRGFAIAQQIKGFQQQEQQLKVSREREQRMAEEQARQAERQRRMDEQDRILQQMESRMRIIQAGGKSITPKQKQILDAGEDFSLELMPGFATTASSAERVDGLGGDTFLLPQLVDLQRAQDAYALDKKEAEAQVGTIPLPKEVADVLGIPEGTPVKPETVDDLMRASRGPTPKRVAPVMVTDDSGNVRFVNPDDGTVVSMFEGIGKKAQPKGAKALSPSEERTAAENYSRRAASAILAETSANGVADVAAAERLAQRRAKEDPRLRDNLQFVLKFLRELAPRGGGSGGDAGLQFLLGIPQEGAVPNAPIPLPEALGQVFSDPAVMKELEKAMKE